MSVIENFSLLPEEELRQFAIELVQKINATHPFIGIDFKFEDVEADELTGDLIISITNKDDFEVEREATWQCATVDEISDATDPDFSESIYSEALTDFKVKEIELDGYKISIELDDIDEGDTIDVNVTNYEEDDSGIGSYDYWGHEGYDSNPFVAVEGIITVDCTCYMHLEVTPII